MTEYGKDYRIKSLPNGTTTRHKERSVKIPTKADLVRELLVAIEPLVKGESPFLELTIKESKDAKWTLVKKWKIE